MICNALRKLKRLAKSVGRARRHYASPLLLAIAVGLTSCTPLRSSDDEGQKADDKFAELVQRDGTIALKFAGTFPLGYRVRIQVFSLVKQTDGNEAVGGQEGAAKEVRLSGADSSVTLDQLEVGRKEIQVAVISDLDDQVGFGSLRLSVSLGTNDVKEPLHIVMIPEDQRRRDWHLKFALSFIKAGLENEVIFADVQPTIDGRCSECHNAFATNNTLNLSSFPFTSKSEGLQTQEAIVNESLLSMADFFYPMPPANARDPSRVVDTEVEKIRAWLYSGLPVKRTSADEFNHLVEVVKLQWRSIESGEVGELTLARQEDMTFGASLRAMKIGGHCDLTVIALGPGGVQLSRQEFKGHLLRGIGDFSKEVRIKYEQPIVNLPVVISQP